MQHKHIYFALIFTAHLSVIAAGTATVPAPDIKEHDIKSAAQVVSASKRASSPEHNVNQMLSDLMILLKNDKLAHAELVAAVKDLFARSLITAEEFIRTDDGASQEQWEMAKQQAIKVLDQRDAFIQKNNIFTSANPLENLRAAWLKEAGPTAEDTEKLYNAPMPEMPKAQALDLAFIQAPTSLDDAAFEQAKKKMAEQKQKNDDILKQNAQANEAWTNALNKWSNLKAAIYNLEFMLRNLTGKATSTNDAFAFLKNSKPFTVLPKPNGRILQICQDTLADFGIAPKTIGLFSQHLESGWNAEVHQRQYMVISSAQSREEDSAIRDLIGHETQHIVFDDVRNGEVILRALQEPHKVQKKPSFRQWSKIREIRADIIPALKSQSYAQAYLANAQRGLWWDNIAWGLPSKLEKKFSGVTREDSIHLTLAELAPYYQAIAERMKKVQSSDLKELANLMDLETNKNQLNWSWAARRAYYWVTGAQPRKMVK
jgi:hypothetical protein